MRASLTPYRPIAVFLAKMLAVYVVWYAVYDLWLLPDGRLDAVVSRNLAVLSGGALRLVGVDVFVEGRTVILASGRGLFIADDCTGLTTVGLFAGFVLAFPGSALRRALFLPAGALAIHLANAGRLAFLTWFHGARPEHFDAVHEWGILPFFYGVVFVLWMVWVRVGAVGGSPPRTAAASPAPRHAVG
ncbi:MAG: archaeosortase/exosortase family protein [Rhodothermales bacterium]